MITDNNLNFLFNITSETVDMNTLYDLFSRKKRTDHKGKVEVLPPMFYATEKIRVKKDKLPNIKEDIITTVGRYIFNLVCIAPVFNDLVPYKNVVLNKKAIGKLQQEIVDLMIEDKVTGEQYGEFQKRVLWLDNLAECLTPGLTPSFMDLPKPIREEFERLVEKHKEVLIEEDVIGYITKIETPILKFAKEYYQKNEPESFALFLATSKPSFENNFKNMYLATGAVMDIATGKFRISTKAYSDGVPPSEYELYANKAITGSYKRSVETQFGGAKTKEFTNSFQSIIIKEEDCGTDSTVSFDVTEENKSGLIYNYIKSKNGYMMVTKKNVDMLVGKRIMLRSPMYCETEGGLCRKCCGDSMHILKMVNAGTSLTRLPNNFMNDSLKVMHNDSISAIRYNPEDYIFEYE